MKRDSTTARPASREHPIGVFDSGVGGLSILKALRSELPHEHFVYVADSGFAPYGERDQEFVVERARSITRQLLDGLHQPVKALVIACNTATAAAIHLLRQDYPDLPIVGVEPALKPAVASSRTGRIGVMATRGTLGSRKFQTLLQSLQGQADFVLQPCDGLADAIERGDATKIAATCSAVTMAMGPFGSQAGDMDTLVLGCTHYPFASMVLQDLVGSSVTLLESGAPVARQTRRLLDERGLLAQACATSCAQGSAGFWATAEPLNLQTAVTRWLDLSAQVQLLTPNSL